jgi:non-specific serine/threonine protein kinase
MDEGALHLMRRQPPDAPVHAPGTDAEVLRLSASLANEVVDARHGASHRRASAIEHVAHRYARALGVKVEDVRAAAEGRPPEGFEVEDESGDQADPVDQDNSSIRGAAKGAAPETAAARRGAASVDSAA